MSHAFGDLLTQYRSRKHGLTQARLARAAGYDPPLITKMCQGRKELTGASGRERVVRLMGVLRDEGALTTLEEANALLKAAGMPPLYDGAPLEAALLRRLKTAEPPMLSSNALSPSPAPRRTNLPAPWTRFIGREQQVAELVGRLQTQRLVTLTGAGGVGKTRLALEVGRSLMSADGPAPAAFGGVWWVELASLSNPALLHHTILSALGLPEQHDQAPFDVLRRFLAPKHLLLILDNCEHLIHACAETAEALLGACPQVHILATSREALRVAGEVAWRVPPLSSPDPDRPPAAAQMLEYEAVALFLDHAAARQPGFALTPESVNTIGRICRRLDGIPLAIEMAAARAGAFSVAEIAAALDDRFALLTSGRRTALPRHRTLRAALDWSYNLLTEPERVLLARLSVFAGGWTAQLARTVCADRDILPLLLDLVDKSLVVADEGPDGVRYRLLETIRLYALDQSAQRGELDVMRRRHAQAYLALANQAEPHFRTSDKKTWFERIARERDNIRAALEWSRTANGDTTLGLRLAGALWLFWRWHGPASEGRNWFRELLPAMLPDTPKDVRARALLGAAAVAVIPPGKLKPEEAQRLTAWLAEALGLFRDLGDLEGIAYCTFYQGLPFRIQNDFAGARAILEQTLVISRQLAHPLITISALRNLGGIAIEQGEFERATALFEECLALARQAGDRQEIASTLSALGDAAFHRCDFISAREYARQALPEARLSGNRYSERIAVTQLGESSRFLGDFQQARTYFEELYRLGLAMEDDYSLETALHLLGKVAYDEGDYAEASRLLADSLRVGRTGDDWVTPFSLEWLAAAAAGLRQPERAARLFGAAESLRKAQGRPLPPDNVAEYGRHVAAARAQLDEAAFAAAWAEGRAMALEQAVEYALS